MKILFIGTDRQFFTEGTEARRRMESYTGLADELHVIVFAKKKLGFKQSVLVKNIILYPTNSRTKLGYLLDAIRIGRRLDDVSLVSVQDPFECALVGMTLALLLHTKLHIQMHIDAFSEYFKEEGVQNRIRSWLARFMLPRASHIRVVSERIKKSVLSQKLNLQCIPDVLPVYVDYSHFEKHVPALSLREKYPRFRPLVLMACRLVPQKDVPTALRAFAQVIKMVPDIGLVIVGEGEERKKMEALTKSLGLKDYVVFEPWQKDMASYLKTADIFLMTSTHEGYQRALGEAAASGTPVVTTDTGPVGSIYKDGDSVLACDVGDDACIAKKLNLLAHDTILREKLVRRAREVAKTAIAPDYPSYLKVYKKTLHLKNKGVRPIKK